MDILEIAAREGNEAYTAAEGGPEAKAEAYYTAHKETLERGRKAEEILAAGGVEQHGEAGWYHVASQSSDRYYVVNLNARDCACPDHQERGTYCKHLQAAELYREEEEDRDPFAVDWEALASEPVTSSYQDSREAAGIPSGRPITTGYTYTHGW